MWRRPEPIERFRAAVPGVAVLRLAQRRADDRRRSRRLEEHRDIALVTAVQEDVRVGTIVRSRALDLVNQARRGCAVVDVLRTGPLRSRRVAVARSSIATLVDRAAQVRRACQGARSIEVVIVQRIALRIAEPGERRVRLALEHAREPTTAIGGGAARCRAPEIADPFTGPRTPGARRAHLAVVGARGGVHAGAAHSDGAVRGAAEMPGAGSLLKPGALLVRSTTRLGERVAHAREGVGGCIRLPIGRCIGDGRVNARAAIAFHVSRLLEAARRDQQPQQPQTGSHVILYNEVRHQWWRY